MKLRHLIQMLFILVLSACGPVINITPTPVSTLPDLVVSNVYLGMQGVPTNWTDCIPDYGPFEIRTMIRNHGQATVYNISVIELSTGTNLTIGELGAGQDMELYFPLSSPNAAYNVVVDPQNTIPESNEGNNTFSYLAITPTPPALCTPSSTPLSNLSTPIPAVTNATLVVVSSLPDLIVSNVYLGMQGVASNWAECIQNYGPFEIRAMIRNMGQAPAYNISVIELSTGTNLTIGELGAGQGLELYFPLASPNAAYNEAVDPQNTIPESNEGNNTFSYLAITPTPPALCTPTSPPSSGLSTPIPSSGSGSATLSQSVLLNSTYRSPDWGEFQLTNGVYYRTPPTSQESPESYTTRIQDPIFYGDLNADGLEDALVILSTQNGGSGHFIELAAVLDQNGNAYNISTISLGDRVVVESGKVENGTIVLNMRVQGPNDGLCCPSQPVIWNFVLTGNQLIKLP
jgi:hypothetical protein